MSQPIGRVNFETCTDELIVGTHKHADELVDEIRAALHREIDAGNTFACKMERDIVRGTDPMGRWKTVREGLAKRIVIIVHPSEEVARAALDQLPTLA